MKDFLPPIMLMSHPSHMWGITLENMSVLKKFDERCFSDWYTATLERVLFPCQTKEQIKQWEECFCQLFVQDVAAVRDCNINSVRSSEI